MSSSSLISVIVPVFKVEDYLDRCVRSIVEQTYSDPEIILIDDGSPDRCPALCDAWAKKDPRIRVIHKENGGVSSARNAGLKVANGEWISFVDSDDWIHPQFFEILQIQTLRYPNAEIIGSNSLRTERTTPFPILDPTAVAFSPLSTNMLFRNRIIRNYVWGRIYKADVIKPRSFDELLPFGEDSIFNAQIYIVPKLEVYYSEEELYYYFKREDSAVGSCTTEQRIYLQKSFLDLASKETRDLPKGIYIIEAIKRALPLRYLAYFESDRDAINEFNAVLQSATSQLRAVKSVSLIVKIKYMLFSRCQLAYRICRIIYDPSMLKWEKTKRKQMFLSGK